MNRKCKIFALYLPQFHRTKENDSWWGEGFTEWNSVKGAKPLCRYSRQPRIPLNGYYDLSNYKSIEQQADIAIRHGVDGFAIYHYYSNGKKLLNIPAELILENKSININFFFSWANHDWRRTWYGYNLEILQKQEYGDSAGIKQHFEYLLDFFKDERYLKIDNKPVLSIYKPAYIPNLEEYHDIWNKLAQSNGFSGIHLIQTLDSISQKINKGIFDSAFYFEPVYTISSKEMKNQRAINRIRSYCAKKFKFFNVANYYDYRRITDLIIRREDCDSNLFYGVFSGWDNTPRHKQFGTVFKNESSELFYKQVKDLYMKSLKNDKELLIINAWNEWSEGAYLEPDTDNQYRFLECIKRIKDEVSSK